MTPFRVFCGWDRRQAEAAEVFAFSVREHASVPVHVFFLKTLRSEFSGLAAVDDLGFSLSPWNGFRRTGTTEFTYSRFMVPRLCDFERRALFADAADMLCLGDVAELAELSMDGCAVKVVKHWRGQEARPRSWTSVMLMDCAHPALRRWTPAYVEEAPDPALMRLGDLSDEQIGVLPSAWNYLVDGPNDDRIVMGDEVKILHWSYLSNPEGGSWIDRSGSALWAEWRERWRTTR